MTAAIAMCPVNPWRTVSSLCETSTNRTSAGTPRDLIPRMSSGRFEFPLRPLWLTDEFCIHSLGVRFCQC